jgi:hypothetical protein
MVVLLIHIEDKHLDVLRLHFIFRDQCPQPVDHRLAVGLEKKVVARVTIDLSIPTDAANERIC